MSTRAVLPPSSAALEQPGARNSFARRLPRLTARARAVLTAVNLHYAGVVALIVFNLYLLAHLVLMLQALSATNADAVAQQRVQLRGAEIAAQPLRGIDAKIQASTEQANQFYDDRLPFEYSQVLTELGAVKNRTGVKLSRVQYVGQQQLQGASQLTEIRMDASLSGEYRPLVEFVNNLERDRMFFLITGITFTGAQAGQVNLRIRVVTYLRQPPADLPTDDAPAAADTAASDNSAPAQGATR